VKNGVAGVDGRVTGWVITRPVRIGLVFEPSSEMLRSAVEQATTLWGGQFQPFFHPGDLEQIERTSRGLGVDVLLAFDRAAASDQAAALDGYQWQGRDEWGPLTPARDYINYRLLGPERVLDDLPRDSWVLPDWTASDPLDGLFRVWFGSYGTSDQAVNLRRQFAERAAQIRIDEGAEVPENGASWITPVAATGAAIEYKGMSPGATFVVVDPSDPASLTALWNARAYGARAFPFPVGHEERILAAARIWLQQLLQDGVLNRWVTGDGQSVGPRIDIWQATGQGGLPAGLAGLLADHEVTPLVMPPEAGPEFARGWYGDHPFATNYAHSFSQPLEADGRAVRIPVPGIGTGTQNGRFPRGDVVALQVRLSAAAGVRPDWTFSVPNKRSLARLLRDYDGFTLNFDRPVADGRALSISSGAREVSISAVPSTVILGHLLEGPGWSTRQTPGGVFVSRFIERLGGAGSTIANQPGARAALTIVARSERGMPSGAVVQSIKQRQGSWPEQFSRDAAGYPASVFQFLLRQSILRPLLPVDCPYCTSSIAFRPEDLTAQMKCEMCLREFPLGLALGMRVNGRNDWLYQLAGHVGHDRLSEALPVMATLQVLYSSAYAGESMIPYVLGWEVKGPQLDCEVDIAAVLDYRGTPAVIVGEVKNWKDPIDVNDLDNLSRIQQHIREKGAECFVLAAVMRELRDDEANALRSLAQRPPNILPVGSAIEPVLPIVLTERNLSATRFEENHPNHWSPADGIVGLAKESCRQNLGMTGLEPHVDGDGFYFRPQWSPPRSPATSDPSLFSPRLPSAVNIWQAATPTRPRSRLGGQPGSCGPGREHPQHAHRRRNHLRRQRPRGHRAARGRRGPCRRRRRAQGPGIRCHHPAGKGSCPLSCASS
jgi:hypothetical protein